MFIRSTWIVLLMALCASAERQIKLEDIERDNLLNERRAIGQEALKTGQTQHLRAPAYEPSPENVGNDLTEDITYVQQPPPIASGEELIRNEQVPAIQYVTPHQSIEYAPKPTHEPYIHPVHEATHTYSAPARESLINPIIHKPTGVPSPYLSQQPRYVYVQAGTPQLTSPSGVLTFGQPKHSNENVFQQQQKAAQDDVKYVTNSIDQNQITIDGSPQALNAPTRQPGRPIFLPFAPQSASYPHYLMVFKNPSNGQIYAAIPSLSPSIQYAPAPQFAPAASHHHLPLGQPSVPTPYDESGILPTPESTPIPASTIPYALPSTHLHPLQLHPTIEYPSHPYQPHPYQPHQPHPYQPHQPHLFQPQLAAPYDLLRSLLHKQPANLVESYIPSSLLYAMQRNRNAAYTNAHILSAVPSPNFAVPTLGHPTHLFQQGSHQPGYNTIAYSTAQAYSKRSPKLMPDHPGKGVKKGV